MQHDNLLTVEDAGTNSNQELFILLTFSAVHRKRRMLNLGSQYVKAQFRDWSQVTGLCSVFLDDTQALHLLQAKKIVFLKTITVNLFLEMFIKITLINLLMNSFRSFQIEHVSSAGIYLQCMVRVSCIIWFSFALKMLCFTLVFLLSLLSYMQTQFLCIILNKKSNRYIIQIFHPTFDLFIFWASL